MRVCIDRSALGTPASLIINDDGTFEWGNGDTCEVCLFDRDRCDAPLEDLARIAGVPTNNLSVAPESQVKAFATLGVNMSAVPWFMAMSKEQFTDRIRIISQTIQDVFRDNLLSSYVKTYGQCRKFLRGLSRPSIDVSVLRAHTAECESGLSVIKSIKTFMPDADGLAPSITYDQSSSATGRLTVEHGPSILTLPKAYRNMIKSTSGGSIYEVDFVSLEPRFVLHIMGKKPPRDIYERIRQDVFAGDLTRKIVKTATISALYGSSAGLISELTGASISARSVIRRVKEYFGADELGAKLSSEASLGTLHNHYGRPLTEMRRGESESKLISYYVQSSCVDTALLGFAKLSESFKSLGASPIYVIHDAVLVDVPLGADSEFLDLCSEGVSLNVGHFDLGVNKIS